MTVLGAERDRNAVGVEHSLHRAQVGEGRMHAHIDGRVVVLSDQVTQLLYALDSLEVVVVHFPVTADERRPFAHDNPRAFGARRSASRPGRSPSSSSSSDAPPPVDT